MAILVVFDTNILFSATGWRGNPFQCVEQARIGHIQAVTCPELMEELAEKLEVKLGFSPEQAAETLADYLGFLRVVSISKLLNAVSRDPNDNMESLEIIVNIFSRLLPHRDVVARCSASTPWLARWRLGGVSLAGRRRNGRPPHRS